MKKFVIPQGATYSDLPTFIKQWGNPEETGTTLVANALYRYLNHDISVIDPGYLIIDPLHNVPNPAEAAMVFDLEALGLELNLEDTLWLNFLEFGLPIIPLLNLDAPNYDGVLEKVVRNSNYVYDSTLFTISLVNDKVDKILSNPANNHNYRVIKKGTNFQAVVLTDDLHLELELHDLLGYQN